MADWIGIGQTTMTEPDCSETWKAYRGWLSWQAWAEERIGRWIDVETAGDRSDEWPLRGEK